MFNFKNFSLGNLTTMSIIIVSVLLGVIVYVSIVAFFVCKALGKNNAIQTRDLTYGAVCISMAYALSFIGITFPQGGTITPFSALPIMLYVYYFGIKKGAVICSVYTLLQFFQNPYVVHPMSAVLDYVIPYMSLIFFGLFSYRTSNFNERIKKGKSPIGGHINFFIGFTCYIFVRYLSHVLSGGIFFGEYAQWGLAAWPYSFVYNLFAVLDAVVCLIGAVGLLCSKAINKFMAVSPNVLQNSYTAAKND